MPELRIIKSSEILTHIKMVVYGNPGVGKTIFAAGCPNPLLVDCEKGTLSLLNKDLIEKGILPPEVDVWPVESFLELNAVYEYLQTNEAGYQTVILDGFSELLRKGVDLIMERLLIKYPEKNPDIVSENEWGMSTQQMRKVIRNFRMLPMHVILTCQVREGENPDTGVKESKPAVTPSVFNILNAYVDIIAYMFKVGMPDDSPDKQFRAMLFQPTEKFTAKDRSGKLGGAMKNPTFPDILRLLGL